MKVLALVTDAFGGYGGIAQYNRDFLTALTELPQIKEVHVLPRTGVCEPDELPGGIYQYSPIYNRCSYSVQASILSAMIHPDFIFSAHVYHGPLALPLASLSQAKLISQLHGDEIWTPLKRRHLDPLKRSHRVICVSRDTRQKYLAQAGEAESNAVVVPNTVGGDFLPGNRDAAREHFGVQGKFAILTVARLDDRAGYKGHDRIISLIPMLREAGNDIVYLIAGEGGDHSRLEGLARRLEVREHVRFLGKVPRDQLPRLYCAADLFALPSTGEGFGIAFLEAMACGTPAIGLSIGGAPDPLMDGALGWCVPPEHFQDALLGALTAAPLDRVALSRKVHANFGFPLFRKRVEEALHL